MDWRHKWRSAPDSRERIVPSPEGGREGSDGDTWGWDPAVRTTPEGGSEEQLV